MTSLLLKNGRIIDPANKRDEIGNLLVIDGRIADQSEIRDPKSAIDEDEDEDEDADAAFP